VKNIILVVEDDPAIQKFLAEKIEFMGGKAIISSVEKEAEEVVLANPGILAIVMDGHLKGEEQNTAALVVRIKRIYNGPILGYTGDDGMEVLLREAGCTDVFKKPDSARILKRLREVLS
jgi:DNA-binding response OmpR family regulator